MNPFNVGMSLSDVFTGVVVVTDAVAVAGFVFMFVFGLLLVLLVLVLVLVFAGLRNEIVPSHDPTMIRLYCSLYATHCNPNSESVIDSITFSDGRSNNASSPLPSAKYNKSPMRHESRMGIEIEVVFEGSLTDCGFGE
ncbi:unnamed protein product [Ambrosiozyma monospora]|uniref:Unnamed protein product n=1 Tax=Ambrosiozyma monospora TaxID=43982 RepID=A0ACB5T207_AMBMO|nr:unnamed protein product [Ambrosiozyma monospora]